jgi:hypothetical protein
LPIVCAGRRRRARSTLIPTVWPLRRCHSSCSSLTASIWVCCSSRLSRSRVRARVPRPPKSLILSPGSKCGRISPCTRSIDAPYERRGGEVSARFREWMAERDALAASVDRLSHDTPSSPSIMQSHNDLPGQTEAARGLEKAGRHQQANYREAL